MAEVMKFDDFKQEGSEAAVKVRKSILYMSFELTLYYSIVLVLCTSQLFWLQKNLTLIVLLKMSWSLNLKQFEQYHHFAQTK